jgi:[acyl-carrier-protein] S-malonyltransferase
MGRFLYDDFTIAQRLFEEASDALHVDFRKLCFDGSEADLALTENTQPCLVLVSTATYEVLHSEFGFKPQIASGHSVGEYSAVVAAGALKFADAMIAVRKRGQAMQEAVPVGKGGMSAVMGLEPNQIFELCTWAERETGLSPVQPANLNAPGQIVISGNKQLLDWISANFKPEAVSGNVSRVKFIPLKVSAPFHCSMMKPAEEVMQTVLQGMKFETAVFPVVQNVSAEAVTDGAMLRENLVRQISAPVRWIECVQNVIRAGHPHAIEVGSGKVLSGLAKKIDSTHLQTSNVNSLEDLKAVGAQIKG